MEDIEKSFTELKQKAQEFSRLLSGIKFSYESKKSEIQTLESQKLKLKEDVEKASQRSIEIIQKATEEASKIAKEANRLMQSALESQDQIKKEIRQAEIKKGEAESLMRQAQEKQRSADTQWHLIQDKQKRLEEALK